MPNINDINGVTVANLAKLDAVLKANISKVNGLSFAAATGLLADYPGAAAAYSTRQLLSTVTVAMRIRRSGDDIEADVEFDSNNEISLTSPISNASSGTYTDLADFVDHTGTPRDAFCVEWKDQSGNGNDATQPTAGGSGLQPKVYDATTGLITENGKPAIDFDGSDDYFDISASLGITGSQARSTFFVLRPEAASSSSSYQTYFGLGDNTTNTNSQIWDLWPEWSVRLFGGFENYNTATINAQYLSTNILSGTNVTDNAFFLDGTEQTATSSASTTVNTDNTVQRIGRTGSSAFTGPYFTGKMQEIVIYASAQTSNRTGIETNINSEYLIYQPTDAPTSGLLATYTGAAAAYSVRQLSDKAVIAMRIRRDSDDEERNIGFDSNGDLDTTAISDFCGTANGYVVEWADQSTNGNHATQSTGTSQPQIYNGTAVITENGKPVLQSASGAFLEGTADNSMKCFGIGRLDTDGIFLHWAGGLLPAGWIMVAQSGSTSTAIYDNTVITINAWRRNGASYAYSSKTRGDIYTDFTSQHLVHIDASITKDDVGMGYKNNPSSFPMFSQQELILYPSTSTHTPSDIESNQNSYFSVYT